MALNAGQWIAGVRIDSAATADAIRATFGERIIDLESLEPGVPYDTALGIRDADQHGQRRELARLYIGSTLLARRRALGGDDGVLAALGGLLDGLTRYPGYADQPTPDTDDTTDTPIATRLFVDERGRAALVNIAQPLLVDDRWLTDRGIREVVCWQPWIDPHSATLTYPFAAELVGAVTTTTDVGAGSGAGCNPVAALWTLAYRHRPRWRELLHSWEQNGLVRSVQSDDRAAARAAVAALLQRGA